jgi:hypothetical protein
MTRTTPRLMLWAAVVAVLATLEQMLWGRDTPGTAHDISVAAWFISLAAAVVFLVALAIWIVARLRRAA